MDHHGDDYRAFRVKDPDGFDLAITNGTKTLRRKTPANAKLPAPAPFEPTGWHTLYLDHISLEVPDYRRSAAFYQALLRWVVRPGNGTQASPPHARPHAAPLAVRRPCHRRRRPA